MKPTRNRLSRRAAGFTLIEVMVAVTVAMILLFGTLYSASESLAVVDESDRRVHVVGQARVGMDRMLADCRYSANVAVTGDSATGWKLVVDTTSPLDPPQLIYSWDPMTGEFRLSDGTLSDVLFENVTAMNIQTVEMLEGGVMVVKEIYVTMSLATEGPGFQGDPANAIPLELGGSVKLHG